MNPRLHTTLSGIALASALCLVPLTASAQQKKPLLPDGYPAKPVRIIVSTSPGGGLDIVMRAVATRLSEKLGTAFVVDNQGGASGAIAVNMVAAAAPDGYTLLCTGGTTLINAVFRKFERDIRQSLAPVVRMSSSYYFLILPTHVPATNIREFIAYAKSRPGALNYGSNGVGSVIHLGLEMIETGAGVDMAHVPYKGVGQVNIDLAAGRLDVGLVSLSGIQVVKAGKARIIATSMPQRHPDHPDVPTIAEAIIPGYDVANTYMLYAPVQTPAPIIAALNREAIQVLAAPEMKDKLAADGAISAPPYPPDELKKLFIVDFNRWEAVIRKAGVKPED